MNVLVTGCGGFLGSEIVRQLLRRGDHVTGVSRREYPDLVKRGMTPLRGDLTHKEFVTESLQNMDAVVHTAAVAGVWGRWDHYFKTNVLATQHVIAACQASQIKQLIFTSSPSATFSGDHQSGVDEREPYPEPGQFLCHYSHTKALAEQAVLAADDPGGLRTVSLRPHLIWGPGDPHLMPRVLEKARSGRLRIVGDGTNRIDTVHVINAAAAHLDALDAIAKRPDQVSGRAYFIAQDEPIDCWDWIRQICELGGVEPPCRSISFSAAYRIGTAFEFLYRTTGRQSEPPMTRFVAAQLAKDHYFDISAAKERLGYHARVSMAQGWRDLQSARSE